MMSVLIRNWWAFVARGIFAVLFGLIALFMPGVTMLSLVIVFAAFAIVDGVFSIIAAVRAAKAGERWWFLALAGIVGILAGLIAAGWPALTVVVFVALIAAWAALTGALELAAAVNMEAGHGKAWMILAAVASLLFSLLLIVAPMAGAIVLTWWIGSYALVFGIAMLVLAFRLRAKFVASPLAKLAA